MKSISYKNLTFDELQQYINAGYTFFNHLNIGFPLIEILTDDHLKYYGITRKIKDSIIFKSTKINDIIQYIQDENITYNIYDNEEKAKADVLLSQYHKIEITHCVFNSAHSDYILELSDTDFIMIKLIFC